MKPDQEKIKATFFVRQEARDYVSENIKGTNQNSYEKLRNAFENNVLSINVHGPTSIDFSTFTWILEGKDRNWWWRIQSLPFLEWFSGSYSIMSNEERKTWGRRCLDAIRQWDACSGPESPLSWHDHVSAFRLKSISIWYVVHSCNVKPDISEERIITPLIDKHVEWLSRDENYSENTNHGLDQSMVLYMVCRMFNTDACRANGKLAYTRLIHEIEQAFTDEGVHKENSPGYQKYMLQRIGSMSTLRPLDGGRVESESKHLIESIKKFLVVITMPNGLLPPIGDTNPDKEGLRAGLPRGIEVYDYSRSGYVVTKGRTEKGHDFFMVVKNCYLSHYHRHDDDLSLFVYYNGDTIFGDGGIYKYAECDARRVFIRSPLAHSVPVINQIPTRGIGAAAPPSIKVVAGKIIEASSYMFGVEVRRTIDLSDVGKGTVRITDECQQAGHGSIINFYLTDAQSAMVSNNALMAAFERSTVRVSSESGLEDCRVVRGWTDGSPEDSAIVSRIYGAVHPCYRMTARMSKATSYVIELSPKG